MKRKKKRILVDLAVIAGSILFAILIVKMGVVHTLVASFNDLEFFGSFLAGLFFTSIFTTAPAIAVLGELAQSNPIWEVALLGGLGAMVGDYIIFRFVRDRFSEDLSFLLRRSQFTRVPALFKTGMFRFITPVVGALIIASPFPDEIGLALLGFSKISNRVFFPLSFTLNAIGIFLIGEVANYMMW